MLALLLAAALADAPTPGAVPADVLDPDVLALLEARGFAFDDLAPRAWPDIATVLEDDLAQFERAIEGTRDDTHRFVIKELATSSAGAYGIESNGDAPRQLDKRWLRSPLAKRKLVAVVPRFDRKDFDKASPCGETRFIYRLAYATKDVRSTLPFFANVVMRGKCADAWRAPALASDEAYATWLARGPLKELALKQVEVNFQSLRFSAGYMTDIGGQALYILRIFRPNGAGAFVPVGLESTPDVNAVRAQPALRERLLAFLEEGDNLERLDEGTLVVPDFDGRFLAKLGVSWSTLGRARLGNKPYRDLLTAGRGALDDATRARLQKLAQRMTRTKSADAVVERLDNLTCMGCHQSGGTAGFHMLGLPDDRVTDAYNQQELPFSPHYAAERARRLDGARFRPHSFFPAKGRAAKAKEACLVDAGDFAPGLPCEAGLTCTKTATSATMPVLFGECVPARDDAPAGSACLPGVVTSGRAKPSALSASTYDFLDGFTPGPALYEGLSPKACRPPSIGVPLGRTFRLCSAREKKLDDFAAWVGKGGDMPLEICAAVGGSKFEECATGDDVLRCLQGAVTRGMVDTCSPTRFCREDYICQRLPKPLAGVKDLARIDALHARSVGFCTPTYFLFNMRADGHPDPITGAANALAKDQRATEYRGGWRKRR